MTELTEEHFELHSANKDAMLQRNKLKYLEDRIKTLDKAAQGGAIVFPSFFHHRVKPVTKGTRYSLVGWVCGQPWK